MKRSYAETINRGTQVDQSQQRIMVITAKELAGVLYNGTNGAKDATYNQIASTLPENLGPLIDETFDDVYGRTALHVATSFDAPRFFRLLVEKGANHNTSDKFNSTTLMTAAYSSTEIVRYLLQELECTGDFINAQEDQDGRTALHYGIENPKAVALLLEHKADLNIRDYHGRTPILLAAEKGCTASAELLWVYGAKMYVTGRGGWNILHYAARRDHAAFVEWLFDIGAQDMMLATNCSCETPLDLAVTNYKDRAIKSILQGYKNMIVAQKGEFCLHWLLRTFVWRPYKFVLPVGTLRKEHMSTLLTIIVSEEDNAISVSDGTGSRPLHIACHDRDAEFDMFKWLVDRDPSSLQQRDNEGNLPIHTLCASNPTLYKIEYLHHKYEASISMTNHQGCSLFMLASLSTASLDVLWYLMRANPAVAVASLCSM